MRSINRLGVLLVAGAAAFSMVGAPAHAAGKDPVNIAAKALTGYTHVGQATDSSTSSSVPAS